MKSYKILFFVALAIIFSVKSFAQNWLWANSGGGTSSDANFKFCQDNQGNSYVAGEFRSDPAIFEDDTLHLNGPNEMYVAKYNSSGQLQWIVSFGGNSTLPNETDYMAYLLFRPQQNSLLIGGAYNGSMTLGTNTLYGSHGFMAELGLNGTFNWSKSLDYSCLCVDEDGYIFTQHTFSQDHYLDTMWVSAGLWFAKFDTEGNLQWARRKANPQPNSIHGTEFAFFKMIERNGIITGYGNSRTDTLIIDTVVAYPFSYDQNILASFDTSGIALWIKPFGGTPELPAFDFLQDSKGFYYTYLNFRNWAIFDSDTLFIADPSIIDIVIAKFDSLGNRVWSKQFFSDDEVFPDAIQVDADYGTVLTGFFRGQIVLGSDTFNSSLTEASNFLIHLDSSGNHQEVFIYDDIAISACIFDTSGYFTACGWFENSPSFSGISLTSNGLADAFIARSSPLTAIEENTRQQNNQLVIYANPNQGRCKLEIPDEFVHERSLLLQIFDNTGRMIQQTQVIMNEDKVRVNLEAEAKGIYNVTLSNKKKSYQGKIVFE
ncbi:MAG: T9SS type A sorting domain-containing protein [Bacteroidia bacterium]|nr:T9SS type A sorting domain-containing protein [Bacteroidia bacterium]